MFRQLLTRWFLWYLERDIYRTVVPQADADKLEKFYAGLWEAPFFKTYVVDRETRFVYALANEKDPEARKTIQGQRIENSLLFSKCRGAFEALRKRSPLPQGGKKPAPSGKR